jgi:hypothetical protein
MRTKEYSCEEHAHKSGDMEPPEYMVREQTEKDDQRDTDCHPMPPGTKNSYP